jgi:hypothetical protein
MSIRIDLYVLGAAVLCARSASGAVLAGPVINLTNGHSYFLLSPGTFAASQAQAVAIGGNLVTINDAAENDWVADTFATLGGVNRPLGTGFNDIAIEGTFVWASGEANLFTNWAPGEPNNGSGGQAEHWAYLVEPGDTVLPPRQWNDAPDSNVGTNPVHGIVEVVHEYFSHAAFLAKAGTVTLIDFDDVPSGDGALTGNEYQSQGMQIINRDGLIMNLVTESPNPYVEPCNYVSMPNVLSSNFKNSPPFFTEAFGDNFDFILERPSNIVGLWIGNVLPGSTAVQFLALDGSVVAEEVFTDSHPALIQCPGAAANNRIFFGVISGTRVERVRTVEPPNDGDGVVYDDLQFVRMPQAGDVTGNGSVDVDDLIAVILGWGSCP